MVIIPESLLLEWHPTKNLPATLNTISPFGHKKYWWVCALNHEWESWPGPRVRGSKCPYCANKATWAGFNDLLTTNPSIADEWHPTKNLYGPETIRKGHRTKAWWLGSCGHEWEATVNNRVAGNQKCAVCYNRQVVVGINDLGTSHPEVAKDWADSRMTPQDVVAGHNQKVDWSCNKKHTWLASPDMRTSQSTGCPTCAHSISRPEEELSAFLTHHNIEHQPRDRTQLRTKELDIWIPNHNLAIEFNGLWWHKEGTRPRGYHHDKYQECRDKNITLLQIWSDDWDRNRSLIENRILMLTGNFSGERVSANKCVPGIVSALEARRFLMINHIQGPPRVARYYGLKTSDGVLRAVLARRVSSSGEHIIDRYATVGLVRGGFTKLMAHIAKVEDVKTWVTFADLATTDGGLYESTGFQVDKILPPDYTYLSNRKTRVHKFNYRKKRFRLDNDLLYQPELTERELATLNGLYRVWDAGKIRYTKTERGNLQ